MEPTWGDDDIELDEDLGDGKLDKQQKEDDNGQSDS